MRSFMLLLALSLPICLAPAAAAQISGIHVTGTGEIRAVPDMARLSLNVRREGQDAAALKSQLDEVTAAVLQMTREMKIPERLVTAAALNIHPRYRHRDGDAEFDGLVATRSIEIILEDLDDVTRVINGALERGVNGVGSVALDVSNRAALERKALDLAIDDARDEAGRIAQRFDIALGPVLDASVDHHQPRPVMMEAMTARAEDAGGSFSPGELTIRRNVQATFQIGATEEATHD